MASENLSQESVKEKSVFVCCKCWLKYSDSEDVVSAHSEQCTSLDKRKPTKVDERVLSAFRSDTQHQMESCIFICTECWIVYSYDEGCMKLHARVCESGKSFESNGTSTETTDYNETRNFRASSESSDSRESSIVRSSSDDRKCGDEMESCHVLASVDAMDGCFVRESVPLNAMEFFMALNLGPSTGRASSLFEGKTADQIKMQWIHCLTNTENQDGLSNVITIPTKGRKGIIAEKAFRRCEFVSEWNGGLNTRQKSFSRKKGKWKCIAGLRDNQPYNLNICAIDVNSKLRIFFTARTMIDIGDEVSYNRNDLERKLKQLRKRNRPIFR